MRTVIFGWGTCEGLNFWDGQHMFCYPQEGSGLLPLSGNLIEKIHPTLDRYSWLRTNYGLDPMFRDRVVESHGEFQGIYYRSPQIAETIVLTQAGVLRLLRRGIPLDRFRSRSPSTPTSPPGRVRAIRYTFSARIGIYRTAFSARYPGEPCRLDSLECVQPLELSYAFADGESVLLIDTRGFSIPSIRRARFWSTSRTSMRNSTATGRSRRQSATATIS